MNHYLSKLTTTFPYIKYKLQKSSGPILSLVSIETSSLILYNFRSKFWETRVEGYIQNFQGFLQVLSVFYRSTTETSFNFRSIHVIALKYFSVTLTHESGLKLNLGRFIAPYSHSLC